MIGRAVEVVSFKLWTRMASRGNRDHGTEQRYTSRSVPAVATRFAYQSQCARNGSPTQHPETSQETFTDKKEMLERHKRENGDLERILKVVSERDKLQDGLIRSLDQERAKQGAAHEIQITRLKVKLKEKENRIQQLQSNTRGGSSSVSRSTVPVCQGCKKHEQTINELIEENNKLNDRIRQLESHQTKEVTISTFGLHQELKQPSTRLSEQLKELLQDRNIALRVEEWGSSVRALGHDGNILIVFCLKTSRLGTDVESTFNRMNTLDFSHVILVVLHHQAGHVRLTTPSSELLTTDVTKSHRISAVLDCVFWGNLGLYDCAVNTEAVQTMAHFIEEHLPF